MSQWRRYRTPRLQDWGATDVPISVGKDIRPRLPKSWYVVKTRIVDREDLPVFVFFLFGYHQYLFPGEEL